MKNFIKKMSLLGFILVCYTVNAQNTGVRLVAVKAGTGHLTNGICTIAVPVTPESKDYFVTITSLGNANALYVTKQDGQFIVTEKNDLSAKPVDIDFDYVIYKNMERKPRTGILPTAGAVDVNASDKGK
jgi:hypothetical protein